jgi:hypothetical protein
MAQHPETAMIVPARYPELARLVWNRDPARPIPGAEALGLYEANWRHIDRDALGAEEAALIRALAERYGGGHLLTTR